MATRGAPDLLHFSFLVRKPLIFSWALKLRINISFLSCPCSNWSCDQILANEIYIKVLYTAPRKILRSSNINDSNCLRNQKRFWRKKRKWLKENCLNYSIFCDMNTWRIWKSVKICACKTKFLYMHFPWFFLC